MYNHLILSALIVMVFEPSKILSSIYVYIEGRISACFRRWYSSFLCFYPFAFAVAKMQEKAPISLKNGYQMIVFSAKRGICWV